MQTTFGSLIASTIMPKRSPKPLPAFSCDNWTATARLMYIKCNWLRILTRVEACQTLERVPSRGCSDHREVPTVFQLHSHPGSKGQNAIPWKTYTSDPYLAWKPSCHHSGSQVRTSWFIGSHVCPNGCIREHTLRLPCFEDTDAVFIAFHLQTLNGKQLASK